MAAVLASWGLVAMVLATVADAAPPARPIASPSDLMSVDASLGATERFVLPNGMVVILAPNREAQVVGMELSYAVGARDEPDGRRGLTSLVQGLMLRRTAHVGPGQYAKLLESAGGSWKWRAGTDRSFFSATVPSDAIALPLWLWSDQMGFFTDTLTEASIAQQSAEIDGDYVRRFDDVRLGHLWSVMDQAIYPPDHPYHRAADRPGPTLRGLTVAEVRAFVERHYTPDRARLVISGAFDPARARALVTRYFATLKGRASDPRRTAARPIPAGETHLRMAAHVDSPAVAVGWSTPAEFEPDDAALDAVAQLLAGSRAGLLRFKLVDQLKIATEVAAQEHSRRLGSLFVITATASPGHTAAELLAAIDGVLADAKAHAAATYLFVGAVMGYVIDHVFRLQAHAALAALYAQCDEHGALDNCLAAWLGAYLSLTSRELSAVMSRQLALDRRVVIEVVPSPDAPLAGALQGNAP